MSSAARFHVRVTKDDLVFSAAHFITFNGDICERLHGHNYRVNVEVAGPLDENRYVYDFVALRDHLRALILEWDHHVLLPTRHPTIKVSANDLEVTAQYAERRWIFPREDCVLLPIEQTTAELLAQRLGVRLLERLRDEGRPVPEILRVGVDENHGQWAVCELTTI
ncbi:MAG: 6-pyruvoyl tetrahydropterin synthase family protein [Pirellulales bacterium]